VGSGSVAASLAFLPLVVHDLALAWTGSALVQVAVSSHPDERETAATTRALHLWRERVKPHWKLWNHSLLRHLFPRFLRWRRNPLRALTLQGYPYGVSHEVRDRHAGRAGRFRDLQIIRIVQVDDHAFLSHDCNSESCNQSRTSARRPPRRTGEPRQKPAEPWHSKPQ